MQPDFFYPKAYDIESLALDTLSGFPGFIYLKSMTSEYLWTNINFSKAATGLETVDALKGGNDYDFHWNLHADLMRDNDRIVMKTRSPVHTLETSQRLDGLVYRLTTYKLPLYKNGSMTGLMGISYACPVNRLQSLLTSREQTCIALMIQGLTDKQIAIKLSISRRTVEAHFNSSKRKLNVRTRAQLVLEFTLNN